ncbi:MAG: 16S rRNA (uracil(1498)-N(3))-methyltransferase [Verrucomicrobiae bacterium]|nr:16S rRNA (uracil(1498)-N(3))-methyltransferase [Verrucomicrobiae bacterium]
MAIDRFYQPTLQELLLTGEEAHHCLHVLRHQVGDRIVLFDGRGNETMNEILSVEKNRLTLKQLNLHHTPRPNYRLTLVQAIPKAKQMDNLLQKATELGVTDIIPLISERTIVQLEEQRAENKREKWQQLIIEAAKQCGQNWLPTLHPLLTVRDYFETRFDSDLSLIGSLQPGAMTFKTIFSRHHQDHQKKPNHISILIGPEGDFTPAEINLALSQGCQPVTLGPIVLKSETAAIFSLSILSYELQNN